MISTTNLPEERRPRAREPRLRAGVPRADALPRRTPRRKVLITIFQRGAVDGLNMIVPFGERDYYAARPTHRDRAAGRGADAALDLDGFFGLHPRLAPLAAALRRATARHRARVRIARRHALALRRAGLHGERHAGRQEHDGRLAEPIPARARARRTATPFRAVALAPQLPRALQGIEPALAIGQIGQFGIRAGQASDMVQCVVRSGVRRGGRQRPRTAPAARRSTP